MPNWCSNVVTINSGGSPELNERLKNALSEDKELFMQFVPRPPEEEENWYSWNVDNWGTKWDATPYNVEWVNQDTVKFSIETAWGPCNKFWEALEEMGYSVTSYYLEEGMAFCGCYEDGFDDFIEYGDVSDLPDWAEDIFGLISRLEEEEEYRLEEEQRELEATWEKTEWYPKKIKPVRVGTYEVKTKAWPYPNKCNWDGEKWSRWEGDTIKVTEWRGITEEQNLEIAFNELTLE